MFNTADILIDVHPIGGIFGHGRRVGARRGKAGKVPRRIDECVHCVGLATGGFTAGRAGGVAPRRVTVQRVAGDREVNRLAALVIGQLDRQVLFLFRHHAAIVAVHDRDRTAPVALPREAPIAQAELGDALTDAVRFAKVDGGVNGFLAGLDLFARNQPGVADLFGFWRDVGRGLNVDLAIERDKGVDDRQVVLATEVVVALIMSGAAKDRAGAIVHQNEVGDIDRQFQRGVKGVADAQAGVVAKLVGLFDGLFGGAALTGLGAEGRDIGVGFLKIPRQRVIGGDADKGRAHQRVGSCRVNLDPVMAMWPVDQREGELQPARAPDPVGLHRLDLGRPVVERIQRVEQFARHVGNLEEPLRQLAPFDQRAGPPSAPVLDLFIGEHGHVDRIPVDHRVFAIDQPLFEEVEEQGLLLAVIFRIAGRKHPRPVEREAQRLHLFDHRVDIGIGPVAGVPAIGHRGVLGRHAKGVKSHRVQDVMPGRAFVARHNVAHGVVAHMADVDASRGVGEHLQHVILRLVAGAAGAKDLGLGPGGLPFWFDLGGYVARHACPLALIAWAA